ncbi:MAG: beta-ketoacyl-ACP synthase 3, partial [Acidobacteria bacterium]|nr:beta-ketoacyl-ACP synthase 3 [Acidobacteriota bacterium]
MLHAVISGTGRSMPEGILSNDDLSKLVETSDEWITSRTGIRERRKAKDGEVLSDFCVAAGRQALEAAGLGVEDLDAVMVATCTPDQPIPAVACIVQSKLGAKKAAAWDLNAACSGWLYGLHMGDALIQSGKAKTILLIGAELLTRYVNYTDRSTCVLFGDGAGATVLTATRSDHGVLSTTIHCDGDGANLIAMPGGG